LGSPFHIKDQYAASYIVEAKALTGDLINFLRSKKDELLGLPSDRRIIDEKYKTVLNNMLPYFQEMREFEIEFLGGHVDFLDRSIQLMPFTRFRHILQTKTYQDDEVVGALSFVGHGNFEQLEESGIRLVEKMKGLKVQFANFIDSQSKSS
jgi:hypothetical protein